MKNASILIVEADSPKNDSLTEKLLQAGCKTIECTPSHQAAKRYYLYHEPDVVIIALSPKDPTKGIEFARFIRNQLNPSPFLFLVSSPDRSQIERAKVTLPAGFLFKPLDDELLYANIGLTIHRHTQKRFVHSPNTNESDANWSFPVSQILYLEADHVYVRVYTAEGKSILQRRSLSNMLDQLPNNRFIQTHRSFAVNIERLSHWDKQYVYVRDKAVPVSRGRRKQVMAALGQVAGRA